MIAGVDADFGEYAPLGTHGEQGRRVLADLGAVLELVDILNAGEVGHTAFYLQGLLKGGVVLHLHLGIELILGSEVEVANLIVDADDRGKAETGLRALQVDAVAVAVQLIEASKACLGSCQLRCSLSLHGSYLLGSVQTRLCCHLELSRRSTNPAVDVVDMSFKELAEVIAAVRGRHRDMAEAGTIGCVAIEGAQTAVDRPVLVNLIGGTHLETEIVLATAHVGIHVVALHVEALLLQQTGNAAYGTLEGA